MSVSGTALFSPYCLNIFVDGYNKSEAQTGLLLGSIEALRLCTGQPSSEKLVVLEMRNTNGLGNRDNDRD